MQFTSDSPFWLSLGSRGSFRQMEEEDQVSKRPRWGDSGSLEAGPAAALQASSVYTVDTQSKQASVRHSR